MSQPNTPPSAGKDRLSINNSRPGTQLQSQQMSHVSRPGSMHSLPRSSGGKSPASQNGQSSRGRTGSLPDMGPMSVLAARLIQKFRAQFGDAAADIKGQEIITQEVLGVLKKGVSVKEEDLQLIQNRIRSRLVGGTPVKNTLADNKRAIHAGDEWANIYQFNVAEGRELEKALAAEEKERQLRVRSALNAQKQELAERRRAEEREEQGFAEQEQADLRAWQKQEEERERLQQQIANKLKQERAEQLQDKQARRQRAVASIRADEDEMAARLAYETKTELDKEEARRMHEKNVLRQYLLQNEENKAIKQREKEAQWEEDAHYKKAWEEVLEKQEKDRVERLKRNMARQTKTAEFAESGKLPEYKKWMDPAIIERHRQEREAALEKDEAARKERNAKMHMEMRRRLEEQVKEREMARLEERKQDQALGQKVIEKAEAEKEKERAKLAAREAAKAALNADIKKQMQDNVANRRYQPISSVERSLNKDLLEKVHDWKLTGSVDCTNNLKQPRHLRTTVKI
ncbi:hypothetical protein DUNSADRAFT_17079 [Dunaliella salina]|uniref:Uncharacterized protein n=1 Tax=Dunaliella salina TaxID=3046 RepID=A0ABQ7G2H3_DUNSA|nr:hypothetical protein DUNSADRAFT_17079 [Dunaliella salina]|eukprot:KAF5828800.1 hypothetical protein DUNSADRAFT_17079 [Dunaliella salina]